MDAKTRKKYATVAGDKYPIKDKHSAESAMKLINHAKPPLTPSQKAKVKRVAKAHGYKESK